MMKARRLDIAAVSKWAGMTTESSSSQIIAVEPRLRASHFLIGLVPFLALFPLHNNDLWWHLAAGRWMTAHRSVPRGDLFSWTNFITQWVDNEWLAELLFYWTWKAGGDAALIVTRAAIFAALSVLLYQLLIVLRAPKSFPAALASAVSLSHHWWELRPSVFSLAGVLLLLIAVERRRFKLIPLLFLIWANLHPGFLFGLVLLAATLAASLLERVTAGWRRAHLPARGLGFSLLISILATLVNPYGWRVYAQQISIASNREYRMLLDEWLVPPLTFLLPVIVALAVAVAKSRMVPLHRLAFFFGAGALSMTAVRFEEYFAWIGVPILLTLPLLRRGRLIAQIGVIAVCVLIGWFPPAARRSDRETDFYRATAKRQRAASAVISAAAIGAMLYERRGRGRSPAPLIAGGASAAVLVALLLRPGASAVEPGRYPERCLDSLPHGVRVFNRLSWGGW
ncbi:MAG TPA: hypothetical protein VFL80_03825, partial [Thermoanaerobaculia bacterium]|nr:hypothetical protein [Thermoanaerobaculia bacterium]